MFLHHGQAEIIKCINGICIAQAIKKHSQTLLEFVKALRKHEESVFRMLSVAASSTNDHKDISSAKTIIEADGLKKKLKVVEPANVGTSNASG